MAPGLNVSNIEGVNLTVTQSIADVQTFTGSVYFAVDNG